MRCAWPWLDELEDGGKVGRGERELRNTGGKIAYYGDFGADTQIFRHRPVCFPQLQFRNESHGQETLRAAIHRLGFEKDERSSHSFRSGASALLNEVNFNTVDRTAACPRSA